MRVITVDSVILLRKLNDNNTGIIMTTVETDEGLYGVQKHEIYDANFLFQTNWTADTTENKDTNVAKNMDELKS